MSTLPVNGQTYMIGKLNALTQFHVSRRLAPLLAQMGVSLHSLRAGLNADLEDFLPVLGPVTDMLARMSDDDANYIIFTCLSAVTRQSGERWAAITAGQSLMFDDIDMPTMLRLVVEVVKDNMGAFMRELPDATQSTSS